MVKERAFSLSMKFAFRILWWDQVMVSPDETRIIVFNNGILKELKGRIPRGGHS